MAKANDPSLSNTTPSAPTLSASHGQESCHGKNSASRDGRAAAKASLVGIVEDLFEGKELPFLVVVSLV